MDIGAGAGAAAEAYKHRSILRELANKGIAFVLGKAVTLAFTGMQGVGKTVLLDHFTGKAAKSGYKRPGQSQAVERGTVKDSGKRLKISVVPGQDSTPKHAALEDLFVGKNPVQGVVHVVSYGYATTRNQDAVLALTKDLKLTTLAKYGEYQRERELEDLEQTCGALRAGHRKHHAPAWLLLAIDKADLYHDQLAKVREYYNGKDSPFREKLDRLARQVGQDFFRWEAAPVCSVLEEFTWNGKAQAPHIDQEMRDAYFAQFLELVRNYCA